MKAIWQYTRYFILGILFFLCSAGPVLAAYNYYVQVAIFNNSSTTYTHYPIVVPLNNTQMNTLGYITASGLDTSYGTTGDDYNLGVATANTTFVTPTLYSGRTTNFYYWLGWTPAHTFHYIITGNGGNVTANDSATLEPAAQDLQVDWIGYIDPSYSNYLLYKVQEYGLFTRWGRVGASVSVPSTTSNLLPDGAGDYTGIDYNTALPNWGNVDDPVGAPDGVATTVYQGYIFGGWNYDAYTAQTVTWPKSTTVSSVKVLLRYFAGASSASIGYQVGVRLAGTETLDSQYTSLGAAAWTNYTSPALARPGGGSWTSADIDSLQIVLGLKAEPNPNYISCTQTYLVVTWEGEDHIVAPATAGTNTVRMVKSGTNLNLYVNDLGVAANTSATAPATVVNTVGLVGMASGPARSTNQAIITINAAEVLRWKPITMYSSTVTDLSGNGNTGNIIWGANPTAMEITVGGIMSPTSFVPPSTNESAIPSVVSPPSIVIFENTSKTGADLPAYSVFLPAAGALEWTAPVLYGIMMFVTSIAMGFAFLTATGSLTAGVVGMGGTFGLAASTGILGFWIPLGVGLICLLLIVVLRGM